MVCEQPGNEKEVTGPTSQAAQWPVSIRNTDSNDSRESGRLGPTGLRDWVTPIPAAPTLGKNPPQPLGQRAALSHRACRTFCFVSWIVWDPACKLILATYGERLRNEAGWGKPRGIEVIKIH